MDIVSAKYTLRLGILLGLGVLIITAALVLPQGASLAAAPRQEPASETPTATETASATSSPTATLTETPTPSTTPSPSTTASPTASTTYTITPSPTRTGTPPTFTATGTITPNPTLSISVAPTEARVGQKFTFTVRITNPGLAPAQNCILSDSFPTILTTDIISSTRGSITKGTYNVSVFIGTIAPGEVVTVTINAVVNSTARQTETLVNQVTLVYDPNITRTASVNYRVVAGSSLPNTGELPWLAAVNPAEPSSLPQPDISMLFLAGVLGLGAFFVGWYAVWLKDHQPDGTLRYWGLCLLLGVLAIGAGVNALGVAALPVAQPSPVALAASPTPEMLAGYPIAPAFSALETQPVYEFSDDGLASLPAFTPPTPTLLPTALSAEATPDTSPITNLNIPALGVNAEVKYVPYDGETWLIAGLRQEIAWLGNSAWPGLGGNTVLAGHVTVRGVGNGPFRYLDQLQAGDQVRVSTELFVYTYQIRSQAIVGENDLWITQPTQASQLTLLTCTDWNAEFQLYLKRLAIFADFVSAEPIVHQGSR